MLTWAELKKAKISQSFNIQELVCCCHAIYGGVAWPGNNPGFAVVIAMNHSLENPKLCLINESESSSVRDLVRQCGGLDIKYEPKMWIGDGQYGPARRFIDEINENLWKRERRQFSPVAPFELLEMKPLYPYILDELKRLMEREHRQLFLPDDSKILSYLSGIEADEIIELELGAYPAIESLAFAVIEMLQNEQSVRVQKPKRNPWGGDNVLLRGLKSFKK